jgi:hypothetical protein
MLALIGCGLIGFVSAATVADADRLAVQARAQLAEAPEAALTSARRALSLTRVFVPSDFVAVGRRGEVVEDEFLAARSAYRRHRARLYEAVGLSELRLGHDEIAVRYLARADALDPAGESWIALAQALLRVQSPRAALATLLRPDHLERLGPIARSLVEHAVDALGWPSAQIEIDRARIAALGAAPRITLREGPFPLPASARLSTGAPCRALESEGALLLYLPEASCRSCSADLERLAPVADHAAMWVYPADGVHDRELRQALMLYRRPWPLLLGVPSLSEIGLKTPAVAVVGRNGWVLAGVGAADADVLPDLLAIMARRDLAETVPRAKWNRRRPERGPTPAPPELLPDGLAPGEDRASPPEFRAASEAYRAGRLAEALDGFRRLEQRLDGWLLPPEARFNQALCLARLGRRAAARELLLGIGDSRFEKTIDQTLEAFGSAPRSARPAGGGGRGRIE